MKKQITKILITWAIMSIVATIVKLGINAAFDEE